MLHFAYTLREKADNTPLHSWAFNEMLPARMSGRRARMGRRGRWGAGHSILLPHRHQRRWMEWAVSCECYRPPHCIVASSSLRPIVPTATLSPYSPFQDATRPYTLTAYGRQALAWPFPWAPLPSSLQRVGILWSLNFPR